MLDSGPYYCDCPDGFIGFPDSTEGMAHYNAACQRREDDCSCHGPAVRAARTDVGTACVDCSLDNVLSAMRAEPEDAGTLTEALLALDGMLNGNPFSQIISIRNPAPLEDYGPAIFESDALSLTMAAMANHPSDGDLQAWACAFVGDLATRSAEYSAALRAAPTLVDTIEATIAAFPPDESVPCDEGHCPEDALQVEDCGYGGVQSTCMGVLDIMDVAYQSTCSATQAFLAAAGCPNEGTDLDQDGRCVGCSLDHPNESSDGLLRCMNGGTCVLQPGWGALLPAPMLQNTMAVGAIMKPYYCECPTGFVGFPDGIPGDGDGCTRREDDCSCHGYCADCSIDNVMAAMRADPEDATMLQHAMDALRLMVEGTGDSQIVSIRNPTPLSTPAEYAHAIRESGALNLTVAAMAHHQDDKVLQSAGCQLFHSLSVIGISWVPAVESIEAALDALPPDMSVPCCEGCCLDDRLQVQDCDMWGAQTSCMRTLHDMDVVRQDACSATPCTDATEFQELLGPIDAKCCDDPWEDCSSGLPATCYADCADVLLPIRYTCATYLAKTENAAIKAIIDQAADSCGSPLPPPPEGSPASPPGPASHCVGNTLPATVQQCLQGCNAFLDGHRGDYREADVTVTGNQTPSCAMGCFLFQVITNRYGQPDVEMCAAWCTEADNPRAGWGNGGCLYSIPDASPRSDEFMKCTDDNDDETLNMCSACPQHECPHPGDCAFGCRLSKLGLDAGVLPAQCLDAYEVRDEPWRSTSEGSSADLELGDCWSAGGSYHFAAEHPWARCTFNGGTTKPSGEEDDNQASWTESLVRFKGQNDAMPVHPPGGHRCSAEMSGWLSSCDGRNVDCSMPGVYPTPADGLTSKIVCFDDGEHTCSHSVAIGVVACGTHYLFALRPPGSTSLGSTSMVYCTEPSGLHVAPRNGH